MVYSMPRILFCGNARIWSCTALTHTNAHPHMCVLNVTMKTKTKTNVRFSIALFYSVIVIIWDSFFFILKAKWVVCSIIVDGMLIFICMRLSVEFHSFSRAPSKCHVLFWFAWRIFFIFDVILCASIHHKLPNKNRNSKQIIFHGLASEHRSILLPSLLHLLAANQPFRSWFRLYTSKNAHITRSRTFDT